MKLVRRKGLAAVVCATGVTTALTGCLGLHERTNGVCHVYYTGR